MNTTQENNETRILHDCTNEQCQRLHQYLTAPGTSTGLEYEDYAYPLRHHHDVLVGVCETPSRTLYTQYSPGDYFTTVTVDTASGDVLSRVERDRVRVLYGLWLEWGLVVVGRDESPFGGDDGA